MQLEQVKPNKPSFLMVVLLSAAAILVIFIAAFVIVGWRSHKKNQPPFSKHPVSQLVQPVSPSLAA